MAERADVDESPDKVRARARTVCIVFPDASEKGEEGGRGTVGDVGGCASNNDCDGDSDSEGTGREVPGGGASETWREIRRSVWRLFWNQTVTERMSLREGNAVSMRRSARWERRRWRQR